MKLDAKAYVRADKNKTKVDDFPITKKVKKLSSVNENLITKDDVNQRIRIASTATSYVDKNTGEVIAIEKTLVEEDKQVSSNKNTFGVQIHKTLNADQGVLFDDGVHSVTMLPIVEKGVSVTGEVDPKHPNKIIFKNFIEQDTLEYVIQENGLKENIIIPCMRDSYQYQFKLHLNNLEAQINGNTMRFLDVETHQEIFTMGNLFMYDQKGNRSKSIECSFDELTAYDYNLTITPNAKWINVSNRVFPVTIDPQIQTADSPVLELKEYTSGTYTPAINNRLVLGVKDKKLHQIYLNIDTEQIVSELVKNSITKFKAFIELHYEQGKRMSESRGFSVYQGSTLLQSDLFKNDNKTLKLDVTSLIEGELTKYHSNRAIGTKKLTLSYFKTYVGSQSDEQSANIKISDDYIYLLDKYFEDKELRPEILLEYAKEDEVMEGTPFLEYETGKSGKTSLNIYNGNLSHSLGLGSIEANALKIDVGLLYDARLKKQMDTDSISTPFGKGWMLNVQQRLVKRDDYNKLLGSKDITYYDGNNNPHMLYEKWYYEENDVRHYIPKDLVYIDNDQKMKYKDEHTSQIYTVEYEVASDEGLSLITTNSKMNYRTTSDKKCTRRYFIEISNQKIEVIMKNGYLNIPMFYKGKTEWIKIEATSETGMAIEKILHYLNCSTEEIESITRAKVIDKHVYKKEFVSYSNVKCKENEFYDVNGNTLAKSYFKRQLYFKNGIYYVKGLKSEYKVETENNKSEEYFEDFENESYDIPVIIEKEFYVDRSEAISDYYENEDIAKINSQIQQIEGYIDDLKLQTKSASNAVHRMEIEINHQKLMRSKNLDINAMRDAATEQNYIAYPPQIYEYEGSEKKEDNGKTCANELNRNLQKLQCKFSDEYQTENYRYQISTLQSQLEEQQVSLDNSYKKLADYETQLANLKEQKETLVAEQKKGVQDYIIDKSGNILGFNYYGKLVYITDSYENEITITYDDNKITEIASKTQRMYFNYNKHNYITSIVDAQGRRKELTYEQNRLFKIIFVAERNQKQEIKLNYLESGELHKITDPSGLYLNAYNNGRGGFRIIQGTTTQSISSKEVKALSTAEKLVDICVEGIETTDYSSIVDYLNEVKTTHYFDVRGRLIHSFEEDLETDDSNSTYIHYENNNKQFEVSFKEDKKFRSYYLGNEINKRFTAVLNLTRNMAKSGYKTTLNPNDISKCKLAFARLDLRKLSQRKWLSLNQITLKAVVIDKNSKHRTYTSLFTNLGHQFIGIPFVLYPTDQKVSVSIIGKKSIDLHVIHDMDFFEAEGTISTYNTDNQLIKTENGTTTTLYEGFVDGKPTRMITIDEFGDRRTSYVSYDSNGRVVYEEDPLRNCKETFYDEKGKIVETREYNKECPTLAKVSKTKYDEQGNTTTLDGVMRDEDGNYPQEEITYLPNSSKVVSTKSASGQVMCYGYDYNTDDLLEISSDAAGQGNSTRMTYRYGLLTSLTHHGFTIDYTLDGQGRKTGITLAGKNLLTNEYIDHFYDEEAKIYNGSKVTTKTIDGFESTTIKDKEGKLVSTITNDNDHILYTYDEEDKLIEVTNTTTKELAHTDYNEKDLVVRNRTEVEGIVVEEVNTYDDKDLVISTKHTLGDKETISEYKYDKVHGNRIYETLIDGNLKQSLEYDALNRVTKKTLSTPENILLEDEYEYLQYGENSLDLIKEHNVKIGGKLLDTVSYTYDVSGNITNVLRDEYKTRYAYDKLNRLVREDNPRLNQTTIYKYDNGGNILLKKTYPYTLEKEVYGGEVCHYTYSSENWKDQLVDYNGQAITYDEMGRPTQIGDTSLSWNLKGQMTSHGENKYSYNLNGIRTSKTVGGIKTNYYLSGNKILREMSNEKDIIYHYAMEKVVGFLYNTIEYIYERNIQGDILGIYKKDDLTKVAEYVYDAYGNHKVINYTEENIGDINPIRYRGYYYDTETKLYYLNSRYYSPEIRRFISPDTLSILDETKAQINGLNLYMYCGDNPIMNVDPSGMNWWKSVCDFFSSPIVQLVTTGILLVGLGIATALTGGAAGVILGAAFYGAVTGAVGGAITGAVGGIINGLATGNWDNFLGNVTSGMMWGAIGGAISGAALSGIRVATGSVKIIGSAQKTGSIFHRFASNVQAGKMSMVMGKNAYSEIHLNRSKGLGIKGFRPDVTGVRQSGLKVVEVVSSTQTYASQVEKVGRMMSQYSHISSGLTLDLLHLITSWFIF